MLGFFFSLIRERERLQGCTDGQKGKQRDRRTPREKRERDDDGINDDEDDDTMPPK